MSTIRVDADGIRLLGRTLRAVADDLEALREQAAGLNGGDFGFVSRGTDSAMSGVVADFERRRIALCSGLEALATAAEKAGACYLRTELSVHNAMMGGPDVW